jgi:D-alanyl-D-alanine carboxypeptidase
VWWKRELLLAALIGAVAPLTAMAQSVPKARVERLDDATRKTMIGVTWSPGCPVGLDDLRRVVVPFVDFDGVPREGVIVVHRDVAPGVGRVFDALFAAQFPIARMEPIEAFGGDDDASTMANNTSAFNCRPSYGADGKLTKRWSQHAYGKAIDVNPVQNPYVLSDGSVLDPAARPYVDRSSGAPGMATRKGVLVRTFAAEGWKWGGNWRSTKDYQHFSITGR